MRKNTIKQRGKNLKVQYIRIRRQKAICNSYCNIYKIDQWPSLFLLCQCKSKVFTGIDKTSTNVNNRTWPTTFGLFYNNEH